MGALTEKIVDKYFFSRDDLDDFSYNSQMKAKVAIEMEYLKKKFLMIKQMNFQE